jgi:hypothetical protein
MTTDYKQIALEMNREICGGDPHKATALLLDAIRADSGEIQIYYVAQIDTNYGVIGLDKTKAGAVRVAAERAKQYLDAANAYDPGMGEPWTVERIIEHFDPRVSALAMGSAILDGVEVVAD